MKHMVPGRKLFRTGTNRTSIRQRYIMDKSVTFKDQRYESPAAGVVEMEIQRCIASSDNIFNEKDGRW